MLSEDSVSWFESDNFGLCGGDWRIDFEHSWLIVHDLTPEQANHWRLMPWVDEIVKIRYPLDCQTPLVSRRYGMNSEYTWYHERIWRGAGHREYHAQGIVRRSGEQVSRFPKNYSIIPPFTPYYSDVMP